MTIAKSTIQSCRGVASTLKDAIARNKAVTDILRRRASERSRALRWNNTVMLAYVVLAVMIVLSLNSDNSVFLGLVAVLGLGAIWVFSRWQAKKLELEFLEEEMSTLADLTSPEESDGAEGVSPERACQKSLSDREIQVLQKIASGKSNKQIAQVLHISEQTVKNHISHIFEKLEVGDRTSAVVHAMSKGLLDSGRAIGD
jgi:DNA-binding CsgD family transcriptional regulator